MSVPPLCQFHLYVSSTSMSVPPLCQFHLCRSILREELGLASSPQFTGLVDFRPVDGAYGDATTRVARTLLGEGPVYQG